MDIKDFNEIAENEARDYARITVSYPVSFDIEKAGLAMAKHLQSKHAPLVSAPLPIIIDLNSEQGQKMIEINPHLFNPDGSLKQDEDAAK